MQSLTKKSNFVTYQIHKISPGKQIYFHKAQYFKKAMEKWKGHGLVKEKPKLRKTIGLKREPKFDKSHEGDFLRVEGRNEKVAEEKERVLVGRNKTFYRSNPRHLRGILNRFKRNNSEEARKASRKVLVTKSTLKNPPMRIQTYSSNQKMKYAMEEIRLDDGLITAQSVDKSINTEDLKDFFTTNPLVNCVKVIV
ncbi:unnamed protein product [Moneuplotes crassus]|uniref:Uncharacterized protein n=1 Tax=Euplotes crassus TaxID=5936 RepID=A0AAD1Y7X1_EUPCR|nr:unnamed protein product [Moneuplotes crassus]